jgi:hypothetical protein
LLQNDENVAPSKQCMSLEESETECPDADHSGGSCIDILGVWNLFDFFLSNKKNQTFFFSLFVLCRFFFSKLFFSN